MPAKLGNDNTPGNLPSFSNTRVTPSDTSPFDIVDVDYLTLTTFDSVMGNVLLELLFELGKKPFKPTKMMQYDCTRSWDGSFVVGKGFQKHKSGERAVHSIGKVSGSLANNVYKQIFDYPYTCSRIDLQLTLPTNNLNYEKLFNCLRNYVNCTLIQSNTPTIYIGSRKSDRFIRIYQHRYGDELLYDRFEVEYKNRRAQKVYDNPELHEAFLLAEVHRLNNYSKTGLLDQFVSGLTGINAKEAKVARKDKSRGIEFYLKVVAPYLRNVIQNPDFKEVIRYDLEQLDLL